MSQKGNSISKGVYLHPQTSGFVTAKQYIFCRKKGKKCLLIRFSNGCDFKISAMNFTVLQLDAVGELIGKTSVSYSALSVLPGKDFSANRGVIVDEKCCDFKVVFDEVYSDDFKYVLKNGTPVAYYEKPRGLTVEGGAKIHSSEEPIFSVKEKKARPSGIACFAAVLVIVTVLLLNVFNTVENMQNAIDEGTHANRPSYGEGAGSNDNSYSTEVGEGTYAPFPETTRPTRPFPEQTAYSEPDDNME